MFGKAGESLQSSAGALPTLYSDLSRWFKACRIFLVLSRGYYILSPVTKEDQTPDTLLARVGLSRADIYELFFSREWELPSTIDFLLWLARHHALPAPPRVMDIGCGTGRLIPPLRRQGWEIWGLEPDPVYRERAQTHARAVGASVLSGGFLSLPVAPPWDLLLAINGPLVYLPRAEERQAALSRCFAALRPGGWLFLDLPNFLFILKNYQTPEPRTAHLGGLEIRRQARHRFDFHDALWLHEEKVEWRPGGDGSWQGYEELYTFAIVSPPELTAMLTGVGFSRLETYNSWTDRAPERLSGPRVMIAAQKPGET